MAHGRSEELKSIAIVKFHPERDPFATSPMTNWEQLIKDDGEFAKRAREDVEAVLNKLHEKRTDEKEDLFSYGMGHHSAVLDSSNTEE